MTAPTQRVYPFRNANVTGDEFAGKVDIINVPSGIVVLTVSGSHCIPEHKLAGTGEVFRYGYMLC